MTKLVRIGVLGCGNVGSAFVNLVTAQQATIEARTGVRLEVGSVAVRNLSRERDVALAEGVLTRDAHAVVADPAIDLVVEVIGGIEPARELITSALKSGKPVVTANKELLANVGTELFGVSDDAGVDLLFEAAVAGARWQDACARGEKYLALARKLDEPNGIPKAATRPEPAPPSSQHRPPPGVSPPTIASPRSR